MLCVRGYTTPSIENMRIKDLVQARIETNAGHTEDEDDRHNFDERRRLRRSRLSEDKNSQAHKMEAQKMNLATEKITKKPPIKPLRWGS